MTTETSKCKHCGSIFQYNRTARPKSYCSNKCYQQHYNQNCRDRESERQRQVKLREEAPATSMLYQLRSRAKKMGLAMNIKESWLQQRLESGVCEITGLPLVKKQYKPGDHGNRDFFSPSIDRINNNVGYIESNCRMVCWGYNLVKNHYTDREVLAFSLATVLQAIPQSLQPELLRALPSFIRSCLPSGNPFVSANGQLIANTTV